VFTHRSIDSDSAKQSWTEVKQTISREKTFQATERIGEMAAKDMLDFSGKGPEDINRIYVKLRDGMPMAAGMRKALPQVDVRYIISQEKQGYANHPPISFYDSYDGCCDDTVWFADPINATGHTAVASLRFVWGHFKFQTALVSHVAANVLGVKNVQTTIEDFAVRGYMNYAYLSTKLNEKGYLADGLELIPDYGDKLHGTVGSDFPIFDLQVSLRNLLGTSVGDAELLKGVILHMLQLAEKEEYRTDRTAAWITRKWIYTALKWYITVDEIPLKGFGEDQVYTLIDDLYSRDFLKAEKRPWKNNVTYVYSLTEEGFNYASRVYIPILKGYDFLGKIQKDFDFLIKLSPDATLQIIEDPSWRK
jgi:uracil phosphoribosyltransferase